MCLYFDNKKKPKVFALGFLANFTCSKFYSFLDFLLPIEADTAAIAPVIKTERPAISPICHHSSVVADIGVTTSLLASYS